MVQKQELMQQKPRLMLQQVHKEKKIKLKKTKLNKTEQKNCLKKCGACIRSNLKNKRR